MIKNCEFIGNDVYYEGEKVTGTDAVGKICRKIKDAGFTVLEAMRNGKTVMTFDVSARAEKSLNESDKAGLRMGKYVPFDFTTLSKPPTETP